MIQILDYKPVDGKGSLLGFVNILIEKTGMEINGCGHFRKENREWINLPSKEYTDKEGAKKYQPIVRYREKNHQDAFSRAVVEAIRKYAPAPKMPQQQDMFEQEELPF
jgi:hypothetical protein